VVELERRPVLAHLEPRRDGVVRIGVAPRPHVAEPELRQQVQRSGTVAVVAGGDPHAEVVGIALGVGHLDREEPSVVEDAGVEQLVLGLVEPAPGVLGDQVVVGERRLRVVVPPPQPAVARHRIEEPVALLDVLAVVALLAAEPEEPLLQDGVDPVPERQPQAQPLAPVAQPGQAVLDPAIGPGPGVVEREPAPRLAVGAVVLADGAPGPLGQERAPGPPPVGVGSGDAVVLRGRRARAQVVVVVIGAVVDVDVDDVLVDVDEVVVVGGFVVVVDFVVVVGAVVVVELDDVVVELVVVLGEVPLSSLARTKMATPPASTRTNRTITAMPSGDDQGDRLGSAAGPGAGAGSMGAAAATGIAAVGGGAGTTTGISLVGSPPWSPPWPVGSPVGSLGSLIGPPRRSA